MNSKPYLATWYETLTFEKTRENKKFISEVLKNICSSTIVERAGMRDVSSVRPCELLSQFSLIIRQQSRCSLHRRHVVDLLVC